MMMSIGLVIANITGSVHLPSTGTADGGALGDVASTAAGATGTTGHAALIEPLSGQAQLTAGFTVLVLELLNDKGAVVDTVPSAQQLAAYRNGTATPPA